MRGGTCQCMLRFPYVEQKKGLKESSAQILNAAIRISRTLSDGSFSDRKEEPLIDAQEISKIVLYQDRKDDVEEDWKENHLNIKGIRVEFSFIEPQMT